MDDNLRVAVVGLMPFPEGGAPTSRLRSLALGLYLAGAQVKILAFASDLVSQISGIEHTCSWRGIPCWLYRAASQPEHGQGITVRRVLRRLAGERLRSAEMRAMYVRLEELCSVGEVDVILFYNQEPEFALKLIRLCQHYDVLYVQQYDELHLANDYPQGILSPLYWREQLHLRCTVSRSDGNMVISTYLQGRCRQAGARSTLLVPALTNTELAVQSDSDPHGEKRDFFTFTYLGKGTRRDCLGLMLESVARVHRALPNCRLCLLGLSRASSMACHALATKLGIDDVVHIAGWLNDTDLQAALHETDAFLLLRTDDRSSRACFPTRLPEFLSLGKPVILSAVGDIPAYFTHMENALVCQPGQIDPVAANMAYLARDPDRARSIGLAGRTLCEDRFDYSKWGRDIALYFRSLTIESK